MPRPEDDRVLRKITITDDLLSAYLDGEVTPVERTAVDQALARDPQIASRLLVLRRTAALMSELPRVSVPRVFTLSEADVAALGREPFWRRWRMQFLSVYFGGAAVMAAMLLMVLLIGDARWTQQMQREMVSFQPSVAGAPATDKQIAPTPAPSIAADHGATIGAEEAVSALVSETTPEAMVDVSQEPASPEFATEEIPTVTLEAALPESRAAAPEPAAEPGAAAIREAPEDTLEPAASPEDLGEQEIEAASAAIPESSLLEPPSSEIPPEADGGGVTAAQGGGDMPPMPPGMALGKGAGVGGGGGGAAPQLRSLLPSVAPQPLMASPPAAVPQSAEALAYEPRANSSGRVTVTEIPAEGPEIEAAPAEQPTALATETAATATATATPPATQTPTATATATEAPVLPTATPASLAQAPADAAASAPMRSGEADGGLLSEGLVGPFGLLPALVRTLQITLGLAVVIFGAATWLTRSR